MTHRWNDGMATTVTRHDFFVTLQSNDFLITQVVQKKKTKFDAKKLITDLDLSRRNTFVKNLSNSTSVSNNKEKKL